MLDLPISKRTLGRALAEQASVQGERPMLMFEDERYTYSDALMLTRSYAGALRTAGVGHGCHVALLMVNHPNMLWTMFALAWLGGVAVPINTAAKGDLLQYFLNHSKSDTLVVDAELLPVVISALNHAPNVRRVIVNHGAAVIDLPMLSADGREWYSLSKIVENLSIALPEEEAIFSNTQIVMYTSGTTGPSKGVICTQAMEQTGGIFMASQMNYGPEDVLYTCLPLFHANAIRVTVTAAIWSGASVALSRRFSATNFWKEVRKFGATQFNSLGAMANILIQIPPAESDSNHRVRICNIVPALPTVQLQAFEKRFGLRVTSLYGSTELCCPVYATTETPADKWPTCGRIIPPFEMKVVDDDDFELPLGSVGEWVIRCAEPWHYFPGYLDMPAETLSAWRNGWFHSGDRGYIDKEGFCYFVDRKKETVRRRGENISSYEVEMIICTHSAVLETAVVPVPAELGEDDVLAFVVLRDGASISETELIHFCEEKMAAFMVPRFLRFIDRLPKTPSEKVEKYLLKQQGELERESLWDREKVLGRLRNQSTQN